MEKKSKLFIHIGAPKTASTFLQQHIFPSWLGMTYKRDLWFAYLTLVDSAKKTIVSNETLFGRAWNRDEADRLSWFDERKLIMEGLARLYPQAQIMVCFRQTTDFILSLYKHYLHEGGVLKLEQFYDFDKDSGVIKREELNYMNTIELLENCFERRPFVFTLEELRDDLPGLLKKLERLFGQKPATLNFSTLTPVNVGVKYWQSKLLRLFNKIDKKPQTLLKPHGLFQWTNPFTKKYGIDPRSISQHRLRNLSQRSLKFDTDQTQRITDYYSDDWEGVQNYINRYCSI
jgi:hypothetical protein